MRKEMVLSLDPRFLRTLVTVHEHGTLTRAAAVLGLTQSALSHQIREAERRVGAKLFHRAGRRLHVTATGEQLRHSAKLIVAELDRAEEALDRYRSGLGPVMRLSTGPYGCHRWLPAFLKDRPAGEPSLTVEVLDGATSFPLGEALLAGELDLAVCGGDLADRRLGCHRLFEDELVAVLPPGHPLCARPWLAPEDFARETYLAYSTISERGFEEQRVFRPARIRLRRLLRMATVETILAMVASGFGVSILSRWAVDDAASRGAVVLRPVTEQGLRIEWHAAIRSHELGGSAPRRLAEEIAAWWGARGG
jgi:LysR family transcriptional regulator for metE and metH